ncbi:MAG: hypothetical protein QOJ60_2508 [Actinomycetota bacterium]|jgi:hypothetical protein|nr:hypothetical protein [Actinomycetota bacterium]
MTRRYDDPVEVNRRDEEPAQFLWRGRHYAVLGVLDRWVETSSWWERPAGPVRGPDVDGSSALATDPAAAPSGSVGSFGGEREVWRVEASPGRMHGSGVYDLCFDWAATTGSGWTLLRTMD